VYVRVSATSSRLLLLELHQHAVHRLGMQEHDRLAMSADLGLLVEHHDAPGLQLLDGLVDVLDLEAHVVDAARRLGLEEVLDGALLAEWPQELELGVAEVHEYSRDAVLGEVLSVSRGVRTIYGSDWGRASWTYDFSRDVGTEGAVLIGGCLDVRHGDRNVVELAETELPNRTRVRDPFHPWA